ncbi:hypothetical protein BN424_1862 [Carnobacterium maltaromaticum LMA28]|uniref:Uncharacterized protein n=1 Tax=Carnobacterium maltaromaticum LMA28 TaxID=1234679 RepID=K8EHI5_CARML|nr:hypothetical protein [Carnobacterium maltaromaticum]CCO11303.2 hypothetical protein BN424_1862 [Carnobacterium maltaromaticum LMA28]
MSNSDGDEIFEVEEIEESSYAEVDKKDLKGVQKYKIKAEEFLLDKHIIVIVCLVAIAVVEFLLINNKSKLLRMIFLNKDNEFQWLAGTAIAAIFTFLFTTVITVRKNKADLVAKSRIEWIQEVKKIMSVFLKDVHYYPFAYNDYKNSELEIEKCYLKLYEFNIKLENHESKFCKPKSKKERIKIKTEIKKLEIRIKELDTNFKKSKIKVNELARKIEENQYLLLLHLSDNPDNKQINDCIVKCTAWVNSMPEIWGYYNTIPVTNLLKVSRDYFKKEWNKSKKGK